MGINPEDYPLHGSEPWDGPLQEYIDTGDNALFNIPLTLTGTQVNQAQENLQIDLSSINDNIQTLLDAQKGTPDGIASLDDDGKIPDSQIRPTELGYAENATGTATPFSTVPTPVPGTLTVPPSIRPVWVSWRADIGVSSPSQGSVQSILYETTGGSVSVIDWEVTHVQTSQPSTSSFITHRGVARVGPSDVTRTFVLYGQVSREGGAATLTGYFRNLSTPYGKTYLSAEAR